MPPSRSPSSSRPGRPRRPRRPRRGGAAACPPAAGRLGSRPFAAARRESETPLRAAMPLSVSPRRTTSPPPPLDDGRGGRGRGRRRDAGPERRDRQARAGDDAGLGRQAVGRGEGARGQAVGGGDAPQRLSRRDQVAGRESGGRGEQRSGDERGAGEADGAEHSHGLTANAPCRQLSRRSSVDLQRPVHTRNRPPTRPRGRQLRSGDRSAPRTDRSALEEHARAPFDIDLLKPFREAPDQR